jgi:LmbE family N-acetylglucosaminyl deacetylase
MLKTRSRGFTLTLALLLTAIAAWSQDRVRATTDSPSYNVGSAVRMKVLLPRAGAPKPAALDITATLRYAGESQAAFEASELIKAFVPSGEKPSPGYRPLWKIPWDAKTGRYEVGIVVRETESHRVVLSLSRAASFAVYRKLVRIDRIQLDRTFYTAGDPVACRVTLKNLTERPLNNLRVEFSDRYWPWIAPSSERAGLDAVPLAEALSLPPGSEQEVQSASAAVAKMVEQPTVHQYAVVVWDQQRRNIFDIAFSQLVFLRPPGVDSPMPYPSQYLYPNLGGVSVSSYRQFYPPAPNASAIQMAREHTMFAAGGADEIGFSILNPTSLPWHEVSIHARLLAPDNTELANAAVANLTDLDPKVPRKDTMKLNLAAAASGVHRAEIEVRGGMGDVYALGSLELGVNPLPKSILIFCAHEDDEMAHAGIIRAAVENRIPVHVVYLTSGDAGSCDRYYQHSCNPAEALDFGVLRMEEARAALGHLGVARDDIYFLGLPDGGLGEIWYNHIQPSSPYLSVLLASDHAPYEGLAHPNLPYARQSVVGVAKEFIKLFQPEVIYTGHPDERHVDHRTNNWFVVKALQELLREGAVPPDLKLLVDQVYGPGPQAHAPYQYQKHVLYVSGEVMARAQEAGWYYQSQSGNRAQGQVRSFDQLPRLEIHWQILDWKDHEGWNEKP